MKLEIKVNNISQIKQISKCLPKDLLSNAVLNGEPLLDYLRNILIFSGKRKYGKSDHFKYGTADSQAKYLYDKKKV